jgi:hypothetical protein
VRSAPARRYNPPMTAEELDRLDEAFRALSYRETDPAPARVEVQRFNAEIERQRALLASARAGEALTPQREVELRAAAILYANERDRIVRRFGLRAF